MITRALSSATTGLVVTTGLFYVMQFLIASGEEIITESRQEHDLVWVRVPEPPDPVVETPPPERIDEPLLPPDTRFPDAAQSGDIGVGFPVTTPVPRTGNPAMTGFGLSDGPLINIIKVRPQYPATAATRNIEGTVTVQFDVTSLGTVENVVVIDSSNKIFNKAAIEAAYRFKYKPKMVDGTSYGAKGLRQLFRFEMEE
jgi:protein TonB